MRGYIEFFQMKGPVMPESYAQFSMRVKDVRCPYGVRKADESYFKLSKFRHKAIISIVKSIEGPQEIDLVLELRLTYNGIFNGLMVTNIYIVVSEYNFWYVCFKSSQKLLILQKSGGKLEFSKSTLC